MGGPVADELGGRPSELGGAEALSPKGKRTAPTAKKKLLLTDGSKKKGLPAGVNIGPVRCGKVGKTMTAIEEGWRRLKPEKRSDKNERCT